MFFILFGFFYFGGFWCGVFVMLLVKLFKLCNEVFWIVVLFFVCLEGCKGKDFLNGIFEIWNVRFRVIMLNICFRIVGRTCLYILVYLLLGLISGVCFSLFDMWGSGGLKSLENLVEGIWLVRGVIGSYG